MNIASAYYDHDAAEKVSFVKLVLDNGDTHLIRSEEVQTAEEAKADFADPTFALAIAIFYTPDTPKNVAEWDAKHPNAVKIHG